jgi:hypothetical protein
MSINVRELLLTPVVTPTEIVPLPELGEGVSVTVKGMTARDKGAFDMQFLTKGEQNTRTQKQIRERMLVVCCVDDNGARIFTLEDVAALGLQSLAIVERIFDACQRVNGASSKAVETAEKNLDATADI